MREAPLPKLWQAGQICSATAVKPRPSRSMGGADRQSGGRHFNLDGDAEGEPARLRRPTFGIRAGTVDAQSLIPTVFRGWTTVPRVSIGDLPLRAPKMGQREARHFRFSQHGTINVCERALSDVSSPVFAAFEDGFQTIGVVGGRVEPGPVTKQPG